MFQDEIAEVPFGQDFSKTYCVHSIAHVADA